MILELCLPETKRMGKRTACKGAMTPHGKTDPLQRTRLAQRPPQAPEESSINKMSLTDKKTLSTDLKRRQLTKNGVDQPKPLSLPLGSPKGPKSLGQSRTIVRQSFKPKSFKEEQRSKKY